MVDEIKGTVKVKFEDAVAGTDRIDVAMLLWPAGAVVWRRAVVAPALAPPPQKPKPPPPPAAAPAAAAAQPVVSTGFGGLARTAVASKAVDDQAIEIEDYTCSTDWERFAAAAEAELRQWLLGPADGRRGHVAHHKIMAFPFGGGDPWPVVLVHVCLRGVASPNEIFDDAGNEAGKWSGEGQRH